MAFMDLTYVVKQTCQKSHSWPLFCEKVHICHCKANGFFLMRTAAGELGGAAHCQLREWLGCHAHSPCDIAMVAEGGVEALGAF